MTKSRPAWALILGSIVLGIGLLNFYSMFLVQSSLKMKGIGLIYVGLNVLGGLWILSSNSRKRLYGIGAFLAFIAINLGYSYKQSKDRERILIEGEKNLQNAKKSFENLQRQVDRMKSRKRNR